MILNMILKNKYDLRGIKRATIKGHLHMGH